MQVNRAAEGIAYEMLARHSGLQGRTQSLSDLSAALDSAAKARIRSASRSNGRNGVRCSNNSHAAAQLMFE